MNSVFILPVVQPYLNARCLPPAGPARTAWVGGVTASGGLLSSEEVCAYAAAAPPTLTPILQSRSPSSLIPPSPITLCPNITCPRLRYCPDTSPGGGTDGRFPWSSQNSSGQGDSPRVTSRSTQTLGGGAGVPWDPSREGLGPAVDREGGTGIVTARRRVLTLG